MTAKVKAEDFEVGQQVMCVEPERFLAEKRRYLTGRIGVIQTVWPSTADRATSLRINEVSVLWLRKNNRGKEQTMVMRPEYLKPVPVDDRA